MSIEVHYEPRFRVETQSYINNDDNYSMHNNYEYHSYLKRNSPQFGRYEDELYCDGKKFASGMFLGHPNGDNTLALLEDYNTFRLYRNDKNIVSGRDICVLEDFYVVSDNNKVTLYNLSNDSEVLQLEGSDFIGYNKQHHLFATNTKVYQEVNGKFETYKAKKQIFAFDRPYVELEFSAKLVNQTIKQEVTATERLKRSFAVTENNGNVLGFGQVQDKDVPDELTFDIVKNNPEMKTLVLANPDIFNREWVSSLILPYYIENLLEYSKKPEVAINISNARNTYLKLFRQNIDDVQTVEGLTAYRTLLKNVKQNAQAIADFYMESFLKETSFPQQSFGLDFTVSYNNYWVNDNLELVHPEYAAKAAVYSHYIFRNPKEIKYIENDKCYNFFAYVALQNQEFLDEIKDSELGSHLYQSVSRFVNSQETETQNQQKFIDIMTDFYIKNPVILKHHAAQGKNAFLAYFVLKHPEIIGKEISIPFLKEHVPPHYLARLDNQLAKYGHSILGVEDFALASNKMFLQKLEKVGFVDKDQAFINLSNVLEQRQDNDFIRENSKRLLQKLQTEDKDIVARNAEKLPGVILARLWIEGVIDGTPYLEKIKPSSGYDKVIAAGLVSVTKKPALDLIEYGKKDIRVSVMVDFRQVDFRQVDFSDFRNVARQYHLSYGSKTTFLNEMLIYGKGREAADALAQGASPFQKVEFSGGRKSGMPFVGLFLRAKKNNYQGIGTLMNKIAENLPPEKANVLNDIEKSLGQTLRQDPEVVKIMRDMRDTFQKNTEENIKKQKLEDLSREFKKKNAELLDNIDERNRQLTGKPIEEYESLFSQNSSFKIGYNSVHYSAENIRRLEETISKKESQHRAEIEKAAHHAEQQKILQDKLNERGQPDQKSLQERIDSLGWELAMQDNNIAIREKESGKGILWIDFSNKSAFEINKAVTQRESEVAKEQRAAAERAAQEKMYEKAKALGCPSELEIPSHSGFQHGYSGWVITSDGTERPCDKKHDCLCVWNQILPDEVVLKWQLDYIGMPHQFEVLYMPQNGITDAQKQTILKIEDEIHEKWQSNAASRDKTTPGVGMGWNLGGRSQALLSPDEGYDVKTVVEPQEETEAEQMTEMTSEDKKRLIKEAKQKLRRKGADNQPSSEESIDLSALANAFGGMAFISKSKDGRK